MGLLALTAACGAKPGANVVAISAKHDAAVPTHDGAGRQPGRGGPPTATAPSRSALLDAKIAERDNVTDWRNTVFGSRAPNPPVKSYARRVPKNGSFSVGSVAEIRAYHYRHSYSGSPWSENGETSLDLPFSAEGRLDGHVVGGAALLTTDEQRRVLALITDAERARKEQPASGNVTSRSVSQCDFAAHHVLVFFDATGTPIGKLFVCLTCHELQMIPRHPAMGSDGPGGMTKAELQTFRAVLDAHGLAAWIYGKDDPMRQAVDEYEARVYGTTNPYEAERYGMALGLTPEGIARNARRAALPSGVALEVDASQLSRAERRRFCVWLDAELEWRGSTHPGGRGLGNYECANGQVYSLGVDTMTSCETQKLRDVPVGRIEACLRSSFLDGPDRICTSGPGPACDGLLDTLPGVVWRK